MGNKPPREGFRPRYNPWNDGYTKKQTMIANAKVTVRWLVVTALAFVYWAALLFLMSLFLLNVWHVHWTELLLYSAGLTAATSLVYALVLRHRRHYY